jgi:uncharacterized protein YjbJ (UPF0337 family)
VNEQTLKGTWNEVKGKIREKWGMLTDDEVNRTGGNLEQVLGMIQRKTGESREQIEKFLQSAAKEGAEMKDKLVSTVQEYASSAAEATQHYASQAAEMAKTGFNETRKMVEKRPMESLAVCFGIGLISGVVVALTMRSR